MTQAFLKMVGFPNVPPTADEACPQWILDAVTAQESPILTAWKDIYLRVMEDTDRRCAEIRDPHRATIMRDVAARVIPPTWEWCVLEAIDGTCLLIPTRCPGA